MPRFLLLVVTCKQNGNVGDFIHRGFTINLHPVFACVCLIPIFLRYTHQFFASSLVIFRLVSRVHWNSLLGSTSVPPHMLESLPISDWKHAPAQHHPNHLLPIHTHFTQVAQLPSSLHLPVSSSPSLQLFPQQSHPRLQLSQESCPRAHECLLN